METLIEIKQKDVDGIIVFEFAGELDETNADKTFGGLYKTIGEFTGKKIIFNFSGLKYLNSKSIGYIADIFSNIEESNGKIYITNCQEGVKDVLELVGITSIIPIADREEEAVIAINGSS
ncbi:anti-sigma factor antagonist, partial [Candidatus Gracilibacteria bacterium]|nr:anti-sigma factor antagonist [Candidatus Gracilibacteria bacterium]